MTLESVSTDHLRQVLAEVDDAAATERLMAAITYKEIDEVTQEDAAELYGYSEGWASKWFNRLERLADEPFEEVVYDEPRPGRPAELTEQEHEQFVEDTPIELCYLPGGSPELNPVEECWRQLNQALGNRLFDTLDELQEAALAALGDIKPPDVFTYLYP